MEDKDALWLARTTPKAWLEDGQRIVLKNAPLLFDYEITSAVNHGRITATVRLPSRNPAHNVFLQLLHPDSSLLPVLSLTEKWTDFDATAGIVNLHGLGTSTAG